MRSVVVRFQQLVQVNHHIFHFGIINSALRGAAPCFDSRGVIRVYAHKFERFEVDEVKPLGIADASA